MAVRVYRSRGWHERARERERGRERGREHERGREFGRGRESERGRGRRRGAWRLDQRFSSWRRGKQCVRRSF
eukprot:6207943-Pleurochrysis_carterae.AAC.1